MSKRSNSENKKHLRNRTLRLENLEARQMLSVSPLGLEDTMASVGTYAGSAAPVVNYEAPVAMASFGVQSNNIVTLGAEEAGASDVSVSAVGTKVTVSFPATKGTVYTIVTTAYDSELNEKPAVFKTVTATKTADYTYSFAGRVGYEYEVEVFAGRVTSSNYLDADAPIGSEYTFILATPKLTNIKADATDGAITLKLNTLATGFDLTSLTFKAKFNNAKTTTTYTVTESAGVYTLSDGTNNFTLSADLTAQTITISGLTRNLKQTLQVNMVDANDNTASAFSTAVTAATAKTTMDQATTVAASLTQGTEASSATVTWKGVDLATTYTIQYTYTNANNKSVTVTATKKASVDANGDGKYIITGMPAKTECTIAVTTNAANGNYIASKATGISAAATVKTYASLPAVTLKLAKAYEDGMDIQITNWKALSTAMGERTDQKITAVVTAGTTTTTVVIPVSAVTPSADGKTATFYIGNLNDNTTYTVVVTAGANEAASGKATTIKPKTALTSYNKVTNVTATATSYDKIDVTWNAVTGKDSATNAASYTVQVTDSAGKAVKTVKVTGGKTSTSITGLKANTSYTVVVFANGDTKFSVGTPSAAATAKTNEKMDKPVITIDKIGQQGSLSASLIFNCGVNLSECSNVSVSFKIAGSGSGLVELYPNVWVRASDSASVSTTLSTTENSKYLSTPLNKYGKYGYDAEATISFSVNAAGNGVLSGFGDFYDSLLAAMYDGKGSGTVTITQITATKVVDGVTQNLSWQGSSVSPTITLP